MADENKDLYLSCLAAAGTFGMWWTYYHQFDGQFLEPESRKSALEFLGIFDRLMERDARFRTAIASRPAQKTAERLRDWANDSSRKTFSDHALSLPNVLLFLTLCRCQVEGEAGGASSNTEQMLQPEMARRLENYLKWRGHFPRLKTRADSQEVMARASRSNSIIVVGDIRRSQDLMTYACDEQDFSRRMVKFITETRATLDKYGGFFDKFTGDGFLAYFNESICELYGFDHSNSFIGFIREFTDFCRTHFREWVKHVKKLPDQPVGLAVGADAGRVSFQNLHYHVVAVGESIVWASRMASAARAEEVLVNNMLYQSLGARPDLAFERREARTKAGEGFQAWKMDAGLPV